MIVFLLSTVDTRAAHLDRSQAKASVQRLAMSLHYRRMAELGGGQSVLRDFWAGRA